MNTTTDATPAAVHAIGDHVIVPGYCRDCGRDTEDVGTITGLDRGPAIYLDQDCYVIELVGPRHHGHVTRVLIPVDAELHPSDRRNPPFCEWCGGPAYHDPGQCRDWYRRTGTLFTESAQWALQAESDRDRLASEIRHRAAGEETRALADVIGAQPVDDPRFLQAMPWFGSGEDCYLDMLTNDELSKIAAVFES
jgi:hypothetical protein